MTQIYYAHHVFFCLNQRENGEDCCMNKGAEAAFDYMKSRVKKLGLNGEGKVRINRAGCLDRCNQGPLLVVIRKQFGTPLLITRILMKLLKPTCSKAKSSNG